MRGTAQKFLFLGAMIGLAVLAYHGTGAREPNGAGGRRVGGRSLDSVQASVPLIVLTPPVPAQQGEGALDVSSLSDIGSPVGAREKEILKELGLEEEPKEQRGVEEALSADSLTPRSSSPDALLGSAEAPGSFYRMKDELPPALSAQRVLVADLKTGEAFFVIKRNDRWPLASLTKLAGAVVVLRDMDLDQSVTITDADVAPAAEDQHLLPGERYRARDLLRVMLSASSNEAAEALAYAYGHPNFVGATNALVSSWGLEDTHFDDPTGLSASNQSTLADLERLVARIYAEYPDILKITRQKSWSIKELGTRKTKTIKSTNLFAGLADFLGGKTGYTDEAGGNLISLFAYKARPVLLVVLGSDDRFRETERLFAWFKANFAAGK